MEPGRGVGLTRQGSRIEFRSAAAREAASTELLLLLIRVQPQFNSPYGVTAGPWLIFPSWQ